MKQKILLTGGAGYIGSHTAVELLQSGYEVLILDNFVNSHKVVIKQIERLTNRSVKLIEGDVRDIDVLERLFSDNNLSGVIHFAGLKAVGESVAQPSNYYDVNVTGSLGLMRVMEASGVKALVFSSSATVYGDPDELPLREDAPYKPESPYGRSKMWVEQAMADTANSNTNCSYMALRYFNPVGAHASGEIGEDPNGIPNNLFPYVAQVAVGRREALTIFGNDYPTSDGTGVRDYIHVVDLARGHVAALDYVISNPAMGFDAVNLGTGFGSSVIDVCDAFEKVSGKQIQRTVGPRREGDVAAYWADPEKAAQLLSWKAELNLLQMCEDGWRWQSAYPNGYVDMDSVRTPESL